MAEDSKDAREGFGDEQGTRVGRPNNPDRANDADDEQDGSLGAGAEATRGERAKPGSHDREHLDRYGGDGGEPKRPA